MKRIAYIILSTFLALAGCSKSEHEGPSERTVLVYIAGANSLSPDADNNLRSMIEGYKSVTEKGSNLIVYFDNGNGTPRLIRIDQRGQKTVKEYPGINSTTAANLSSVIAETINQFPARSYGLILWSHATGWAPQGFPLMTAFAPRMASFPATRTFGHQVFNSSAYEIELADLAKAIPSGTFDFLIADACYMGAVEVSYALRDKAGYIISSPAQVLSEGMPYAQITPELMSGAPVETLCRNICAKYYNYYNGQSGFYRSASVSLVKTSALQGLRDAVAPIVKSSAAAIADLPLNKIQYYDAYTRPFMYDLDDFIRQIASPVQYEAFKNALKQTVLYEAHTDYFFNIKLERCCGLSTYIPGNAYAGYDAPYRSTEWYQACYL